MNTVVVAVVVLFYIQKPGLDWVLFPFYAVAAMGIGCGCGIVMQILPWPTRGSKELLEALGAAPQPHPVLIHRWCHSRAYFSMGRTTHTHTHTGLSLNAASRGVQCAIGHFTANEKHDVERLYLSEKAQLMTQKIVENIAIAKAVCLRRTATVRVSSRKLTKAFFTRAMTTCSDMKMRSGSMPSCPIPGSSSTSRRSRP